MTIRIGTLVPNTETPVGEGVNAAVRAIIKINDSSYAAIVKRVSLDIVLAECFCGKLFEAWGLPTPEPVIVNDGSKILFASLDVGYPNLKHRLGWDDNLPDAQKQVLVKECAKIICSWKDAPLALAADEAIGNSDRNLGNFLWDGTNHSYIDHERTLGVFPHTRNILAEIAILIGKENEISRSAVSATLTLDRSAAKKIPAPTGNDFSSFVAFVEGQLQGLANLVLARFPKPIDLLSGLGPP
ncbi:hypothetical protein [Burkholderia glumae]|uniref:hypothetical protein n=1 Tax=Burkholderia glumae TaxID=337 RepID=UPI00214FB2AF|nr:hypothetical protein [Burkholderia glumae]